ncbi:hypothetical protein ACS8YF_08015 [Salinisphaera sp. SWV1]
MTYRTIAIARSYVSLRPERPITVSQRDAVASRHIPGSKRLPESNRCARPTIVIQMSQADTRNGMLSGVFRTRGSAAHQ